MVAHPREGGRGVGTVNLELREVPSLQRCGRFGADGVSTLGLMRSLTVSVLSQEPSKGERSGDQGVRRRGVRCHRSPEGMTAPMCKLLRLQGREGPRFGGKSRPCVCGDLSPAGRVWGDPAMPHS